MANFNEYFGFREGGIDHHVMSRLDRGFLKAVLQGRYLPADARLFLQMNPDQILAAMAGCYLAARDKRISMLKEPIAQMYSRFLLDGRELFSSQLDFVNNFSRDRNVRPYFSDDVSMTGRLMAVMSRNPDLQGIIDSKCAEARHAFETGLKYDWDPNSDKKAVYVKPILEHFKSVYDTFRGSPKFMSELQAAKNLEYKTG